MDTRRSAFISTGLPAIMLLLVGTADAAGVTWRVANDGADNGTCGPAARPCRSISQAMENATDGDTIQVGAGFYGDVSGTGFTQPGDERPATIANQVNCMICITKALRIVSLHGAAVTFIRAPAGAVDAEVLINHDNVMFGNNAQGFTVSGGNPVGVGITLRTANCDCEAVSITGGIRIIGNVDIGDNTGFQYLGPETSDRPCVNCRFTAPVWWSNNDAVNNSGAGFYFKQGPIDAELLLIENNSARNGGNGFYAAGSQISFDGLGIGPNSAQVINNVALGNSGFGFRLNGTAATTGNVANGNSAGGFLVVPNNEAFSGNSAIGNGGPGVIVNFSVDGDSPNPGESAPAFHAFSHNNFYGNDRHRPVLQLSPEADGEPPYNPGPGAHCGVLNVGELSGPGDFSGNPHPGALVQLPANDNFWGSAQGPSATGPGDAIGGACDQNNGTTIVKTFATASF